MSPKRRRDRHVDPMGGTEESALESSFARVEPDDPSRDQLQHATSNGMDPATRHEMPQDRTRRESRSVFPFDGSETSAAEADRGIRDLRSPEDQAIADERARAKAARQ